MILSIAIFACQKTAIVPHADTVVSETSLKNIPQTTNGDFNSKAICTMRSVSGNSNSLAINIVAELNRFNRCNSNYTVACNTPSFITTEFQLGNVFATSATVTISPSGLLNYVNNLNAQINSSTCPNRCIKSITYNQFNNEPNVGGWAISAVVEYGCP